VGSGHRHAPGLGHRHLLDLLQHLPGPQVLHLQRPGGGGAARLGARGDAAGRRLYVGRSANPGRVTVFNLDTLEKVGEVPNTLRVHGATVSPKSKHGFASSNPVVMFDSKTLATIKTIEVKGNPDGYLYDPFNDRVYILSHSKPHATAINAADGSIVGTIDDLGGAPEEAATDGKGTIYVDIEDAHSIAVVDAKTLTVKTHYDLAGKGDGCAGLALDVKNQILFAACRNPQNMVILSAKDGKILETLPLAGSSDGAVITFSTTTVCAMLELPRHAPVKTDATAYFKISFIVLFARTAKSGMSASTQC